VKVIQADASGRVRVLGTCRPWSPEPQPGEHVQATVPAPDLGEDPVWGPLFSRVLRWPVVRTPDGEAAVLARPGGPDPAQLPGWAPARGG
jgi:hypothetical protein